MKPITIQEITQEQFNQALHEQAKNLNKSFQVQFQALCENMSKQEGPVPVSQDDRDRLENYNFAEKLNREIARRREQKELDELIKFRDIIKKKGFRRASKLFYDSRADDDDDLMDTFDLLDDDECLAKSDYEIQIIGKKK